MSKYLYRLILAFGANIGDREKNFTVALNYLQTQDPTFKILNSSRCVSNAPFQNNAENRGEYLNFICECITEHHPLSFYEHIIVPIEDKIGHSRTKKWAPRALDIDILLGAINTQNNFVDCNPLILEGELFTLPHKRLLDPERKILRDLLKETLNLTEKHIQCHFTQITCEKN